MRVSENESEPWAEWPAGCWSGSALAGRATAPAGAAGADCAGSAAVAGAGRGRGADDFWWPLRRRRAGILCARRAAGPDGRRTMCPHRWPGAARCQSRREGLMVALLVLRVPPAACASAARSECAAASLGFDALDDSLCPDADHAAARDPDGHDAAGAAAGGLSLSAPGAGHADRALESHAAGTGADDDLVPDDAGAEPGGPAGGRAVSRRADHRHGGHRSRRAAGEAFPAALCAGEGPGAVHGGGPDSAARIRPTICPCAWWFRPTFSPS